MVNEASPPFKAVYQLVAAVYSLVIKEVGHHVGIGHRVVAYLIVLLRDEPVVVVVLPGHIGACRVGHYSYRGRAEIVVQYGTLRQRALFFQPLGQSRVVFVYPGLRLLDILYDIGVADIYVVVLRDIDIVAVKQSEELAPLVVEVA